ncbi:MAG: hypothetical protein S4CHLAM107_10600 [Chlamydiia bacterium]|nr:hypothetical protein [Chlamydiia bacterium]
MTLVDWQAYLDGTAWASNAMRFLMGHAPILLGVSIFLQLLGGVLVLFGWRMRIGLFFLILTNFPELMLTHPFWLLDGAQRDQELMLFLQHLAIFGGLLALFSFGRGTMRQRRQVMAMPSFKVREDL